jgi:hypothetical protein
MAEVIAFDEDSAHVLQQQWLLNITCNRPVARELN